MRARLKALTTITAVLVAVAALLVAGAPGAARARTRLGLRAKLRHGIRARLAVVRQRMRPALGAAAVIVVLAVAVFGYGATTTGASDRPRMRLASASVASTSTTAAPTTTTTVAPTTTTTAPPPPPAPAPVRAETVAVVSSGFVWPARGPVWSGFGRRASGNHHGADIGAPSGAPIVAVLPGVVTFAGWEQGYGLEVRVDHGNGMSTLYAHMSRTFVRPGQRVGQGEQLGAVGSTGRVSAPHLHFEVRLGGVPQNPMRWLATAR